jgi:hypothetical protein
MQQQAFLQAHLLSQQRAAPFLQAAWAPPALLLWQLHLIVLHQAHLLYR